ncbi:MAG TPA: immunoglobulin domain-containing protein, partial [Verrucomicrobiae bacterium]
AASTQAQVLFTDTARNNTVANPLLKGISRTDDGGLDPRPATGSPALTTSRIPSDSFYTLANYKGAFSGVNWAADWTALGAERIMSGSGAGAPQSITIPVRGPSSSQDPQVEALVAGVDFTAIITVGDTAANSPGWRYVGLGDGLGAYDNTNGTFTALVNHEINETLGITRAHGAKGTFVSKLIIDKATLQVLNGQDLMTNVYTFNTNSFVYELGVNVLMGRFCSADLPPVSAFYNSGNGKGTQNRIFMNGEEFSTQSRAWAHIASGPETGNSWQLPLLGRASWENVVASPYMQDKTIVVGLDDDGTTDSQVYIYIGTKQTTGASDVEKAGLMNGQLYGVSVAGLAQEVAGTTEVQRNFSLVNLSALTDVRVATFNQLETVGNGAGVTAFMRVEDGSWNPLNPREFYFLTTASASLPSRLWRLTFNDIANPEAGGVIEMMLNGTEGQIMMDNMVVDQDGNILITEDPGNNARLARAYKYYPATDGLIALGQAKQSLFKSGEPGFITQDEEVSGVIDMRDILGNGAYLIVNQIHNGAVVGNDPELVEGGQLLVMYVNGTTPSINSQPTPVSVGSGTAATFTVAASAGSTIQWYKNGVPIATATGTSYSIPSPTTGDAGQYVAVVTSANGSVASTTVALTVTDIAMYAGVAIAGPIGAQYDVQYTESLEGTPVWTTLERVTLSTSPMIYIDQTSPGENKRFYRALEVAP